MVSTDNFGTEVMVESDLIETRTFTEHDFVILRSYEAVVDGLATLIGPWAGVNRQPLYSEATWDGS